MNDLWLMEILPKMLIYDRKNNKEFQMLKSFLNHHLVFIHVQLKLCIFVLNPFFDVHLVFFAALERKTWIKSQVPKYGFPYYDFIEASLQDSTGHSVNYGSKFETSDSDFTLGTKGAPIFLFKRASQSTFSNQGCFFISLAPFDPSLFSGFFWNNPSRRFRSFMLI